MTLRTASTITRGLLLVGVALLAACTGGDAASTPTVPPIAPAPVAPGVLNLSSSGLPAGVTPLLKVTGP